MTKTISKKFKKIRKDKFKGESTKTIIDLNKICK